MLTEIFPLLIGDLDNASYNDFFLGGCCPSFSTTPEALIPKAVEDECRRHLDSQGLGTPLKIGMSIKAVFGEITKNQGGKVEGQDSLFSILNRIADEIQKML